MANSVGPDQTGAVCSGSMLFSSILNLLAILCNYLQQTTSADDHFRCIFSWRFKGENKHQCQPSLCPLVVNLLSADDLCKQFGHRLGPTLYRT